jgi:dynein intermediate chain 2, axonemal
LADAPENLHAPAACQVEKDEEYAKAVVALGATVVDVLRANNAIDVYEDYFAGRQPIFGSADVPRAATLTVLRDPSPIKRAAQYLSWHPGRTR